MPEITSLEPAVVVRMLAVTPGLSGAALMAAAIPASVSLLESTLMVDVAPPTLIASVPVPIAVVEPATAAEVRVAEVARFWTSSE